MQQRNMEKSFTYENCANLVPEEGCNKSSRVASSRNAIFPRKSAICCVVASFSEKES
jgi:hypothetical protein